MADIKIRSKYQGKIAKVALTDNEYIALLTDGTVAHTGNKDKPPRSPRFPAGLKARPSWISLPRANPSRL